MNLLNRHFKLFLKNWKLGLMVFATASLFLLPAIFISAHYDVNSWWFILASLITAGTALAFFVAETQKELMSRGTGFLLPGLGSTVFSVQIITMSAFTLIAFLVAFFLPRLAPVTAGNILNSLSFSVLVAAAFLLTLLIDFLFKYSAWVASFIVFPYFLFIRTGKTADVQFYNYWLGNSGLLFLFGILLCAVMMKLLVSLNLPRRLAEQPFLSTLQLYQPTRVQEFKNRNAAHVRPKDQSHRPLKQTMDTCLEKSSRARFAGKESRAIFWDSIYLGLATGIPRGFMGGWNYVLFILPFVLVVGYADSMRRCDSSMIGWYSAFPFMFATLPLGSFHFLGNNPMGFPRSRKATEKAGYLFIGWTLLTVILLSLLIFGAMHLLALYMPEFESASRVWSYHAPSRIHTPFLPVLILPVILFVYFLWPRSSSQVVLWGGGMQVFLIFNFLLSNGEEGWPVLVVLGISLGAWIVLPLQWRRRIMKGS